MAKSKTQELEWLIIFLVYNNSYYDLENQDTKDYYTMEEQTKYILNQIRYSNHSEKVKTIFVEAEIKNHKTNPVATISFLYKKEGTWLSAVDGIWRDGEAIDILTNEKSLTGILEKLKYNFPAKKHMIITAGHGSIVGINYYIPKLIPKSSREINKEVESIFRKPPGFLSGIKFQEELLGKIELEDGKQLLFLSNQDISNAVNKVFTDKKVDVLVMYNCLVQNIFTQFDLREAVDWLVAPLSGISIPGFNYGDVLNEIIKDPSIGGEMVSSLFINSIRTGNRYTSYKKDIEGTWKIAAIKMNKEKYELIQEQFESLFSAINAISKNDIRIINCINETVRFLFNYSFYCLKEINISDLGILMEFLKETINISYPQFKDLFPKIEALQAAMKLENKEIIFEGTDFYESKESFKEQETRFKAALTNVGLLFPFLEFESNILMPIYDKENYKNRDSINTHNIPPFLKSDNYAAVINALLNLPQ